MDNKNKKAFTLAETMIVLVVLGIVAAITVPALVRNQMEAQNRTRIRKSMTVYDMVLNKIVVENNLKSNAELIAWADSDTKNDCANTSAYFKVSRNLQVNGVDTNCRFCSSDNVCWDISNILNPNIGIGENFSPSFSFIGHIDNKGILRINDLAYEQSQENNKANIDAVTESYNYISGKKTEQKTVKTIKPYTGCYNSGLECTIYDKYGNPTAYGYNCNGNFSSCYYVENYNPKYDEDGNMIGNNCIEDGDRTSCVQLYTYNTIGDKTIRTIHYGCSGTTDISECWGDTYYATYDSEGRITGETCNETGTSCIYLYTYNTIGDKIIRTQRYGCENATDISGCAGGTGYNTYDSEGRQTGYGCNEDGTSCQYNYTITEDE